VDYLAFLPRPFEDPEAFLPLLSLAFGFAFFTERNTSAFYDIL
jgi:hypothetical protein